MKTLYKNWLTEGLMDVEYKQYILLDYFKSIITDFREIKLYPGITDLLMHYQNLQDFRQHKQFFVNNLPKAISGVDLQKMKVVYEKISVNDNMMQTIEEIIEFALPRFQNHIQEGKDIYDFIEEQLEIQTIGLTPLNKEYGYLFLAQENNPKTYIYEYHVSVFESSAEKFRGIHTEFVTTFTRNFGNTYQNMKLNLVKERKHLPNPAIYAINSNFNCPINETLLPVSKRLLMRQLAA